MKSLVWIVCCYELCIVYVQYPTDGHDCSLYAHSIIMTLEMTTMTCCTHHESGIGLHVEACTSV
jgi:hypothetical protein